VEVLAFSRDAAKVVPGVPLRVTGRLSLPPQAMNPGEFDLRRHLTTESTFSEFECSRLEACPASTVPWHERAWTYLLGLIRSRVSQSIGSCLPEEEGAVLKGILLGDRSDLPPDASLDFRRSGFYRFATIAGFHVDLVFALSEKAIRKVTRRPSLSRLVSGAVTFLYGSLSGWTPGAIRAFTCASMKAIAPALRRRYYPLAGLSVAGLAVAWIVPFPLADPGFQLSFAGALGGFVGWRYGSEMRTWAGTGGPLEARLRPPALALLRVVVIFLFLLPAMASSLQDVSLVGFALGGIWAGVVAALVPASVAILAVPGLGRLAGWAPYLLLKGVRQASSWAAGLPWASFTVPAPGRLEAAAYYGLLLLLMDLGERRLRGRADRDEVPGRRGCDARARPDTAPRSLSLLRPAGVWLCSLVLFLSAVFRVYLPWPRVTFFSVGQADCALIRFRASAVLVDTGTRGACEDTVLRQLRRLGVTRVDAVALSHLHQDHVGGLQLLCQEVRVGAILTAPGTGAAARSLLGAGGPWIPQIVEASPGSTYRIGSLEVLTFCSGNVADTGGSSDDSGNDQSLVLVFRQFPSPEDGPGDASPGLPGQGFVLEFWGDAPSSAVAEALSLCPLVFQEGEQLRVVKVPHHGSRDALVDGFYERMPGGIAVVSVGPNSYGHPSNEVLQAAASSRARLFRTDVSGAVTVDFILGRARAHPFR
jgi:competence protein ComEC